MSQQQCNPNKVRHSDTLPEPDEVLTLVDSDGEEYVVKVKYGNKDWRDVIARIIRNHYLD
jgi:hypothetical protein